MALCHHLLLTEVVVALVEATTRAKSSVLSVSTSTNLDRESSLLALSVGLSSDQV